MNLRSAPSVILAILIFAGTASASPPTPTWVCGLTVVAAALGWLMMILMGIKWMIADSPNERAEAKKGMIYIVLGLLVIASRCQIMGLYQTTAAGAGITVDISAVCSGTC